MGLGNEYRDMVASRTGLKPDELVCPREQSVMTPCAARDGDLAVTKEGMCAGCDVLVAVLVKKEAVLAAESKGTSDA